MPCRPLGLGGLFPEKLPLQAPLHRRVPRTRYAYSRPTDWVAEAGTTHRIARTRAEAVARLKEALGVIDPPKPRPQLTVVR
jgi:hypothetical protein